MWMLWCLVNGISVSGVSLSDLETIMEYAALIALLIYAAPYLITVISVWITIVHSVQEAWAYPKPIWEYLNLTMYYPLGLGLLIGFSGLQIWLAIEGYALGHKWGLQSLIIVRLADCILSHWWPYHLGGMAHTLRPNPGL
jgi:hypothetical protein